MSITARAAALVQTVSPAEISEAVARAEVSRIKMAGEVSVYTVRLDGRELGTVKKCAGAEWGCQRNGDEAGSTILNKTRGKAVRMLVTWVLRADVAAKTEADAKRRAEFVARMKAEADEVYAAAGITVRQVDTPAPADVFASEVDWTNDEAADPFAFVSDVDEEDADWNEGADEDEVAAVVPTATDHATRAQVLREQAAAERAKADAAAERGSRDDAHGSYMLSARDSNRHGQKMDAALRAHVKHTQTAAALESKALRAEAKADEAARVQYTAEELKGAILIQDKYGWHKVVRVNTKTVTVETPYSWTETIAVGKVLAHRKPEPVAETVIETVAVEPVADLTEAEQVTFARLAGAAGIPVTLAEAAVEYPGTAERLATAARIRSAQGGSAFGRPAPAVEAEPVAVVAEDVALAEAVEVGSVAREQRAGYTKAERKAANRDAATLLRAEGIRPDGAVWETVRLALNEGATPAEAVARALAPAEVEAPEVEAGTPGSTGASLPVCDAGSAAQVSEDTADRDDFRSGRVFIGSHANGRGDRTPVPWNQRRA